MSAIRPVAVGAEGMAGLRLRSWLVALVVFVASAAWAPGANAAGTSIMPLGDSITDGYNVPGGYRIGLEDSLSGAGYSFDFVGSLANGPSSLADREHEGHTGWRIDQISADVGSWLSRHQPEVVLLMIGTNDVLQSHDLANAPARLGTLLDRIAAGAPAATVIVSSLTPLGSATRDERVRAFNAAIPGIVADRVAQGRRIVLVDMYSALTPADLADGVHPSAAGYAKMAPIWHAALQRVLPAPAATRTVTFTAAADTMVKQASAGSAFGATNPLKVDGQELSTSGSSVSSYLRFDVAGLQADETVEAARLVVQASNGTANGPALFRTDPGWTESKLTWSSIRPARLAAASAGNFGSMATGRSETAIGGVTGNGAVSLELAPESTDGLDFASRESSTARPQLVLTVAPSSGEPPPPPPPPAPPATRTLTLFPTADTMVRQANPSTAHGAVDPLGSDARELSTSGSAQHAYLRFDVPALATGERIADARLNVVVRNTTTNGPAVWRTAAGWSEGGLTWNGRSTLAARAGTAPVGNFAGMTSTGRTGAAIAGLTGGEAVSFELAPESTDGLDFASREDGSGTTSDPTLVLTVTTG